jgi:hypothetical protein
MPSASPRSEASGELPHDSVAQVVTTDLVVRSRPGVTDESEIYPTRLNEPMLLYVVDGPVRASGFDWYQVQPFELGVCVDVCPEPLPFGWVAQAGNDGEVWIAPGTVNCPSPTVAELQLLDPMARLACFGDRRLELDGTMGSCFAPAGYALPPLLVEGCVLYTDDYEPPEDTFGDPGLKLRGSVSGEAASLGGEHVRVTGQFDDPSAEECGPDLRLVLLCRAEFVVSEVAVRR